MSQRNNASRPERGQVERKGYRPLNEGYSPKATRGYVPKATADLPAPPKGGTGETARPASAAVGNAGP